MRGEPFAESFRGIAAEADGRILGVAGVMHTPELQLFSSLDAMIREYPVGLVKAARALMKILEQYDTKIYAVADPEVEGSIKYLEYMGFEHYSGRIYRWVTQ